MTQAAAPVREVKPPAVQDQPAAEEEPSEDPSEEPAEVAKIKPKPQPPRIKARALMGLAHHELARVMGVPGFKRIDDPAALWQYRGARCILDVYLYADGPVYRVTHLEFRRGGTAGKGIPSGVPLKSREAEQCFSTLVPGTTERKG